MCDPECSETEVANLEHRAASKTGDGEETFALFVRNNVSTLPTEAPKLLERIVAACDNILAVQHDEQSCIDLAAKLGKPALGAHDIVAALERRKTVVTDSRTISDFAALAGSRVEAPVIARWQALAPDQARHERDADLMNSWATWRGLAARALAGGGKDARAFLVDQLAQPSSIAGCSGPASARSPRSKT